VALPFAAGRGQEEGGEIPPDQSALRSSCPGSTVLSPKIAAVERRKAMRFQSFIVSQAMPEAKRYKVRLAALHAPRVLRGKTESTPRAMKRGNDDACLSLREWGKPHTRMLFEN
jgi:hypothetical protein